MLEIRYWVLDLYITHVLYCFYASPMWVLLQMEHMNKVLAILLQTLVHQIFQD